MEVLRKKAGLIGLILLIITALSSKAQASSISATYSGQFTNAWSETHELGQAKIEYGFNTFLVREDTCYAYHSNASHYAKIKNGNGVHAAGSKRAGEWSRLEVQHSGSRVIYYCEW